MWIAYCNFNALLRDKIYTGMRWCFELIWMYFLASLEWRTKVTIPEADRADIFICGKSKNLYV